MAVKAIIAIGALAIGGFIVWQLFGKSIANSQSSNLGADTVSQTPNLTTPQAIGNGLTASPTASGQNINISENINYSPTSTENLNVSNSNNTLTTISKTSTQTSLNPTSTQSGLINLGNGAKSGLGNKNWWLGL